MNINFLMFNVFIFSSSMLAAQSTNQRDAEGRPHGLWRQKIDRGILFYQDAFSEGEYRHGELHGLYKEYRVARNKTIPLMEQQYENGRQNGIRKGYYSNGDLSSIISFVNDTMHGYIVSYYKGKIISKRILVNKGKLDTVFLHHRQTGILCAKRFQTADSSEIIVYYDGKGGNSMRSINLNRDIGIHPGIHRQLPLTRNNRKFIKDKWLFEEYHLKNHPKFKVLFIIVYDDSWRIKRIYRYGDKEKLLSIEFYDSVFRLKRKRFFD